MAKGRKAALGSRNGGLDVRIDRLESAQRETNRRLGRIEDTLATSSKLFELMHERLENLEEGQKALVEGQKALVEGQKLVIERLDRLVEAAVRDRTHTVERVARLESRVEALEQRGH